MVTKGDADAMICGASGEYKWHLEYVEDILGLCDGVRETSALSLLVLDRGPIFIGDTYVSQDPSAEEIVDFTIRAAEKVSDFGLLPKVALISASNFGSSQDPNSRKMQAALQMLQADCAGLEVEGEMQPHVALDEDLRLRLFPNSRLEGTANLLIMPGMETANTAFSLSRALTNALHVGPILIGIDKPGHITTPSVTSRGLVNLAALAVIDAQMHKSGS